ncbi:MAG: hypothetical protein ACI8WB_003953 [Phenylobacterium sp.]|jgi:uncharacterized protein (DUF2132 family)
MANPISSFFKKGHALTTLEESLATVDERMDKHSIMLNEMKQDNVVKGIRLERVQSDNASLEARVKSLEDKLYQLKIVANSDDLILTSNIQPANHPALNNKQNNQ